MRIIPHKHFQTQEVIGYEFYCPGCEGRHIFYTKAFDKQNLVWGFNGKFELPTFTPSLLNTADYKDGRPREVCHLFVTNGEIQYLGDCTHSLAGQTIILPETL